VARFGTDLPHVLGLFFCFPLILLGSLTSLPKATALPQPWMKMAVAREKARDGASAKANSLRGVDD
jgi:hypothetical protein